MPPPRSRRSSSTSPAMLPPLLLRAAAIIACVVVLIGSSPPALPPMLVYAVASSTSSLPDVVPFDEKSLDMAERLLREIRERVSSTDPNDAPPPSWNDTLLPAMISSFASVGGGRSSEYAASTTTTTTVPPHEERARRLAVRWLVDIDGSSSILSSRRYDDGLLHRYALATIYYATGGDGWTRCSHSPTTSACGGGDDARYLSSRPHLEWDGVNGRGGMVTMLDLGDRGLSSPTFLPPEIVLFCPTLELLWINDNPDLRGTLPSYVGEFANLASLAVQRTSMSGSMPESMYALSKLTSLRMYGSKFGGEISSDIGALVGLKWLWLHDNDFVGTVPDAIGTLEKLEGITLHGNRFRPVVSFNVTEYGVLKSNIIPDALCNLTDYNLRYLWTDCEAGSVAPAVVVDEGRGSKEREVGTTPAKFVAVDGIRPCSCCTRCFPRIDDAATTAVVNR
ncbi:hypothetical protein ACHAXA_005277 [Cyclostephanos tholiformis]|uniref:Uncharacterized protein n=1 Tax=Cyclostephanos tholiformis TaxID=382380 RepID=A0ABD3R894_9STRA